MALGKWSATEEARSRLGLGVVDQLEAGLVLLVEVGVLVVADELRRVLVHVLAISVRGAGPVGDLNRFLKIGLSD